jgi:hypothetical protein
MPQELQPPQGQATEVQGTVPPIQQATAQAQQAASPVPTRQQDMPPEGMQQQPDGSVKVLSPSAYRRLKDEARERGKRAANEEVNTALKAAGYSSMEELIRAAKAQKQHVQQPDKHKEGDKNRQQQPNKPNQQNLSPRQVEQLNKQLEQERKEKADASRRARDLQRKLDATEAERVLEHVAFQVGIKDTDYAIRLLTRKCDAMTDDELKAFDERKFFEGLRTSHPYLFQEIVQAATTGTSGGNQPPPPNARTVTNATASNGQVDAMAMKPGEFLAHLRRRGLTLS